MLYSLIYVSTAIHLMEDDELLAILHTSVQNNTERSITGILLYKGGNFLQVLEGEKEDVQYIFEKIQADRRHTGIIVISEETIESRLFADWKMAFVNLDHELIKQEPAYSFYLQSGFEEETLRIPMGWHTTSSLHSKIA